MTEQGSEQDRFLGKLRKRFSAAAEDEKHLRDKFVSDLKFASPDGDDQWDPVVKMQREQASRPAMSFPRCHTFVQQVSNEARQNKPQIKFAPRLDADKDTAEVYEGLARYIQYSSDAQVAYETAVEYSAGGSFGYYRFLTDYADDDSDDLELKIVPVLDPLTIYGVLVPACFNRKPMYAFVVEEIPKEEYKLKYPESEMATMAWREAETANEGWVGSEAVKIAEYWWVEEKRVKGKRRPKSVVKFCKTNGLEILPGDDGETSQTDWPGSTIPIIPVLGKQMIIEGQARLFSVVRPQKGAQQLINYSKSRIAETLSTAPISPFIAVEGQTAGYEAQWKTINTNPQSVVYYKAVDVAGRPAPAPARQTFEPPIQALSSFVMQEVEDMKATTGIYDAALGSSGTNETSGQMVMRRQQQSNLTTMHFLDNLERSFKQGGKVMEEVIPLVYDTKREITILGKDEAEKVVQINAPYTDESGKKHHYNLADVKLGLIVTMGRSFDSKRMESFDMMQQVIQANPDSFPMIADIFFKNSDMAGADQLAERYQKMLPPQLQPNQDEAIPPQAQAQIAQLHQQTQEATQIAQQLMQEKQGKAWETQGKLQIIAAQHASDMVLEDKKLLAQITVAEIQTKAQNAADREADRRALEAQFHDQSHDAAMAAAGAQQAQQSQQMDQAHQQGMQADQQAGQSAQSAQDAAQGQDAAAQQAALQPAQSGGGE
jgi:hypothetical protein